MSSSSNERVNMAFFFSWYPWKSNVTESCWCLSRRTFAVTFPKSPKFKVYLLNCKDLYILQGIKLDSEEIDNNNDE